MKTCSGGLHTRNGGEAVQISLSYRVDSDCGTAAVHVNCSGICDVGRLAGVAPIKTSMKAQL